jgi:hypothetical protein
MLQVMIIEKDILVMKFLLLSALRSVIQKYSAESLPSVPTNNEKAGYGPIHLQKKEFLFDILNRIDYIDLVESENPISMESVGQVGRHHILYFLWIQLLHKDPKMLNDICC